MNTFKFLKKSSNEAEEKFIPERKIKSPYTAYVMSAIIGMIIMIIATAVSAAVMSGFNISPEKIQVFSSLSSGVGGLCAGLFIGASKGEKGMISGAFSGFLTVIPTFVAMIIKPETDARWIIFSAISCGALGGIISVNKN